MKALRKSQRRRKRKRRKKINHPKKVTRESDMTLSGVTMQMIFQTKMQWYL
jgi:hypothetical protein